MLNLSALDRFVRRRRTRDQDQPNPLLDFESEAQEDPPAPDDTVVAQPPRRKSAVIPAIILVVGLALAGTQWRQVAAWVQTPTEAPPASVVVRTEPPGAQVMLDGEPRGVTPLTIAVPAGTYALTIRNGVAERSMTLTAAAGADIVREIELRAPAAEPTAAAAIGESQSDGGEGEVVAEKPAAVANVAGWLSVQAPFEVQVLDAGEVVGNSSLSRMMLPAGRRDVELVNRTLEFSERRRIAIAPGRTAAITLAAPQVAININARPWADVTVDGIALGQTPIANAMMAIGSRQFVFRHPELGEHRQDVVITSKPGQRISLDLTK